MKIYSINPLNALFRQQLANNNKFCNNQEVSNNDLIIIYPSNYYLTSSVAFGAKNVELIAQMEKAIRSNKFDEVSKLFEQMTVAAQKNVKGLVEKFKVEDLTLKDYLSACVKRPQLFYLAPETIEKNVKGLVEKFKVDGLTIKDYLPACVKQPQLFYQSPETLEKNVREFVEKFKSEGLTIKDYLPACVKLPQLFYQFPETLEKNVREFVEKFISEGLTIKDYLSACVKLPQLFSLAPETIEKILRGLVEKFKSEGLTIKDYLPACVKQPQLFYQSPETIEKNVREFVEKFKSEGLTLKDYLPACVKQQPLFCQKPDTIAQHIDIIRFSKYNMGQQIDNAFFWKQLFKQPMQLGFSNSLLLTRDLIIPKMFEGHEIPKGLKGNRLKQKLNDYLLANPDKKFVLNLKKMNSQTDCVKVLADYLEKLTTELKLKKNTFTINIIE